MIRNFKSFISAPLTCLMVCSLSGSAGAQSFSFVKPAYEASSGDVIPIRIAVSDIPDDVARLLISIRLEDSGNNQVMLSRASGRLLNSRGEARLYQNTLDQNPDHGAQEYRAVIDFAESPDDLNDSESFPVLQIDIPCQISGFGVSELSFSDGNTDLQYPLNGIVLRDGSILRPVRTTDGFASTRLTLNPELIPPYAVFSESETAGNWIAQNRGNVVANSPAESNDEEFANGLTTTLRTPGASSLWKWDEKQLGQWKELRPDVLLGMRWKADFNAAQSRLRLGITTAPVTGSTVLGSQHSGSFFRTNSIPATEQNIWAASTSIRPVMKPLAGLFSDSQIEYFTPETATLEWVAWMEYPVSRLADRKLEFENVFSDKSTNGWDVLMEDQSVATATDKGLQIVFSDNDSSYALWRSRSSKAALDLESGRIYRMEAEFSGNNSAVGTSRVRVVATDGSFETHHMAQTDESKNRWIQTHWFQLPVGLEKQPVHLEFDGQGSKGSIILEKIRIQSYELPVINELPPVSDPDLPMENT